MNTFWEDPPKTNIMLVPAVKIGPSPWWTALMNAPPYTVRKMVWGDLYETHSNGKLRGRYASQAWHWCLSLD